MSFASLELCVLCGDAPPNHQGHEGREGTSLALTRQDSLPDLSSPDDLILRGRQFPQGKWAAAM